MNEEYQKAIRDLMEASDIETKKEALEKLGEVKGAVKTAAFNQLRESLEKEEHGAARTWLVSALAKVNADGTRGILAEHIDPAKEKSERVRYRTLIALATLDEVNPQVLKEYLEDALKKDKSFRVKAVALRLLIENGCDDNGCDSYIEEMRRMTTHQAMVDERWAALKALRSESGNADLPEEVEKRFKKNVQEILDDENEWRDVRYQAALVLGDAAHVKTEATWALSQTIKRKQLPKAVLLNCIDALAQLNDRKLAEDQQEKDRLNDPGNRQQVEEALLIALQDDDPSVNLRATEALQKVATAKEAVEFIVEDMLQQSKAPDGYFDALRRIDSTRAARTLSDNLLHHDRDVRHRATDALTQLGGADALRSLHVQRSDMMATYTELLDKADGKIMDQFDRLMKNARFAFKMSMVMHGTTFIVGILLILISIGLYIWRPEQLSDLWQVVLPGIGGGALTVLILFYKDPLRNIGHSVNRLVKVNVVFLGYVRQINQIDATFKQMFITMIDFGAAEMEKTVNKIQETVGRTLEEVKAHLVDLENEPFLDRVEMGKE